MFCLKLETHAFAFQTSSFISSPARPYAAGRWRRRRRRGRRRSRDGARGARPGPAAWRSCSPGLRSGCHGQAGGAGARRLRRLRWQRDSRGVGGAGAPEPRRRGGGFGVAKNLCSWAVDGKNCTVNEHVNSTLQAFHSAKKPIGLCCISPVLAAKVFPGCEVTVGQDKNVDGRFPDAETASAIAELGCKHICKNVNESHVDKANKIVTTCAFMCKAPLHEIFDGIGTMVQEVLKLA
ncbi:glutamine amidotransferase-like class 1 domain-containing protein 3, mitochondrial isoform 1-T1 [Geothlypis trichas]